MPTRAPSQAPSHSPTNIPSMQPTTADPTQAQPSLSPSGFPTLSGDLDESVVVDVSLTPFELSLSPLSMPLDNMAMEKFNEILDALILDNVDISSQSTNMSIYISTIPLSQTAEGRRIEEHSQVHNDLPERERRGLQASTLTIRLQKIAHISIALGVDQALLPNTSSFDFGVLTIFRDATQSAALASNLRSLSPEVRAFDGLIEVQFVELVSGKEPEEEDTPPLQSTPDGINPRANSPEEIANSSNDKIIFIAAAVGAAVAVLVGGFVGWTYLRSKRRQDTTLGDRQLKTLEDEVVPSWDFDEDGVSSIDFESVVGNMIKQRDDQKSKTKQSIGSAAKSVASSHAKQSNVSEHSPKHDKSMASRRSHSHHRDSSRGRGGDRDGGKRQSHDHQSSASSAKHLDKKYGQQGVDTFGDGRHDGSNRKIRESSTGKSSRHGSRHESKRDKRNTMRDSRKDHSRVHGDDDSEHYA